MKLRKGDQVIVISGPERGAKGEIIRVLPDANKVVVDGTYEKKTVEFVYNEATGEPERREDSETRKIGSVKRHRRTSQNKNGQVEGGIIEESRPIHAARVALLAKDGKPVRIGYRLNDDGTKTRIGRRQGKEIEI